MCFVFPGADMGGGEWRSLVCAKHFRRQYRQHEMGKRKSESGYIAVSYTHLDVYKRQLIWRVVEALLRAR